MSVQRLVPLHAVVLEDNPSSARIGDIYYNSVSEELKFYESLFTIKSSLSGELKPPLPREELLKYCYGSKEYFEFNKKS
jgi:hypothetical protein